MSSEPEIDTMVSSTFLKELVNFYKYTDYTRVELSDKPEIISVILNLQGEGGWTPWSTWGFSQFFKN